MNDKKRKVKRSSKLTISLFIANHFKEITCKDENLHEETSNILKNYYES